MNRVAACTIISKNYLAFARTLMTSIREVHPEWDRHVLLVDEIDGAFEPGLEDFELVELVKLALPDLRKFAFRYSLLEFNTAVKPWLLERLFGDGYDQVIYLDPDILVYSPLTDLIEAFDAGASIVLTPHLTAPLDDEFLPGDKEILQAGTYNLGFIGIQRSPAARSLFEWWKCKNEFDCVVDVQSGLFVDQKWMDLAPGLFEGVSVLRHEGYNVAYWNLASRQVEREADAWRVNRVPLVFFHFSGFDPCKPAPFSKHQNRFTLREIGPAAELARDYARRVLENSHETCRRWDYAFGRFRDGTPIIDAVRRCYRTDEGLQRDAGEDPFGLPHDTFNEPAFPEAQGEALITRVMKSVWDSHPELRERFPDLEHANRAAFAATFVSVLAPALDVPAQYVAPVTASLSPALSVVPIAVRALNLVSRFAGPVKRRLSPRARMRLKGLVRRLLLRERRVPGAAARLHIGGARSGAELANSETKTLGVNLTGYHSGTTGVSEAARRWRTAAEAAGINYERIDCSAPTLAPAHLETWGTRNLYSINVLVVNADQTPIIARQLGDGFLGDRYNIGVWHWELPELPDEWLDSFSHLDEIWAPSQFVQEAVSAKSPIPVVRMPYAIDVPQPRVGRERFGLPRDRFLFLAMFDFDSITERKNPRGAVRAFQRAFPDPSDVELVLKTQGSDLRRAEVVELRREIEGLPGVVLVDGTLSREDVYALEGACDAFVSLHRSEGFGLVIAECMYLGKPVVATYWSGNVDYMTCKNSCPVDYELVALERDYPPYRKGQIWADPDLEQAAWYMRRLATDAEFRGRIAAAGAASIRSDLSPNVVGRRYRQRLESILGRI